MHVVEIIGRPATGKSTAMRKHSLLLGVGHVVKKGRLTYHVFPSSCSIVMGLYDEKEFSGTDRLSKSVGPEFRAWLTEMADDPANIDWVVYWEGERFSNSKCLDCMMHSRFNTRLFSLRSGKKR